MQLSTQQLHATKAAESRAGGIVTIAEYRRLSGDKYSSDEKILERMAYLECFCRAVIQNELNEYAEEN